MVYILFVTLVLLLIFGPNLWVRHVLKKYHQPLAEIPGTGGELASHLLHRFNLDGVLVEQSVKDDDHYSPSDNAVRLSPEVYEGRSLSAIAIAAHEVGHAIQFNREESVSLLREKYLGSAAKVQQLGVYLLMAMPIIGVVFRVPHLTVITGLIGVLTLFSSVLLYLAVLPQEWDASFNKALPILEEGGYVPEEHLPAIRSILKACALTYVAAALADIFRLWRWLQLIR